MSIDWLQLLPQCPKCKSNKTISLGLYRFKYDSHNKKRSQMKYKCQICGEEFWN